MAELYIYYRIELNDEAAYETQLRAMQARLGCSAGVKARLLKSCAEPALRMEIYSGIVEVETFLASLEQAVERFEVDMFLAVGERRRVECFTD